MESIDMTEFLVTAGITVVKWLVYTGLLWFMIRIQKLNYNLPGLFASSLAATLVAMIPFVGGYLAYAVLLLCLWKCTGAEIVPDVVFTVCIAGALMFCFNLFAISALMGKLRPDLSADAYGHSPYALDEVLLDGADSEDEATSEENDGALLPAAHGRRSKAPREVTTRIGAAVSGPHSLRLKGVTVNTERASALVSDGRRTQTVFPGESFAAEFRDGRARLRCETITKDGVLLVTEHGERVVLHLKRQPGEEPTE